MPPKLLLIILAAAIAGSVRPASAQEINPRKTRYQIRIGATAFSPLVKDGVRSQALADSIDADQSSELTIRQRVAPTIAVAALLPLRPRTDLEISAAYGTSELRGEDDFETWHVGDVGMGNLMVGVAHDYRPSLVLHGGVGLTRLFAESEGIFADGNGTRPLLEAGVSWRTPISAGLQLGVRVQTHTFTTATLSDEGAGQGTVFRITIAGSYTFGGSVQ